MPTTPREYLSLVASGKGQAAARSTGCQARRSGIGRARPMSINSTRPQAEAAGSRRWQNLSPPKVTVSDAVKWDAPAVEFVETPSPVDDSAPAVELVETSVGMVEWNATVIPADAGISADTSAPWAPNAGASPRSRLSPG